MPVLGCSNFFELKYLIPTEALLQMGRNMSIKEQSVGGLSVIPYGREEMLMKQTFWLKTANPEDKGTPVGWSSSGSNKLSVLSQYGAL